MQTRKVQQERPEAEGAAGHMPRLQRQRAPHAPLHQQRSVLNQIVDGHLIELVECFAEPFDVGVADRLVARLPPGTDQRLFPQILRGDRLLGRQRVIPAHQGSPAVFDRQSDAVVAGDSKRELEQPACGSCYACHLLP